MLEVTVVLLPVRIGHEPGDVFADHFAAPVTEHLFRRAVDALNDALLVDGNDSISHVFKDGEKTRLGFLQRGL